MTRKIDALVAEHVMGLDPNRAEFALDEYSTDIAAAWEVVEKMSVPLEIIRHRDGKQWGVLDARFRNTTWADTAPLAICLAALKAKGVEVPHD